MSLYEDLSAATEKEHKMWTGSARLYASLSLALRGSITMLGAAILAAKTLPSWKVIDDLVPGLAITVGALTALEAWIRPAQKWKGFLGDRDDLDRIRILAKNTSPEDETQLSALLQQFTDLRARHVRYNVF